MLATTFNNFSFANSQGYAEVRLQKFLGDKIDMPSPEEREDLNMVVAKEEREPCKSGIIKIVDDKGNLVKDDIKLNENGFVDVKLAVGNYVMVDKIIEGSTQLKKRAFSVKDRHLEKGLLVECYNKKDIILEEDSEDIVETIDALEAEDFTEEDMVALDIDFEDETKVEGVSIDRAVVVSKPKGRNYISAKKDINSRKITESTNLEDKKVLTQVEEETKDERNKLPNTGQANGWSVVLGFIVLLYGLSIYIKNIFAIKEEA